MEKIIRQFCDSLCKNITKSLEGCKNEGDTASDKTTVFTFPDGGKAVLELRYVFTPVDEYEKELEESNFNEEEA